MIFPNLRIQVWKRTGADVYGQPRFFRLPDERVAPVKMEFTDQHTTVRTDSGASHGHAQESVANVIFLVRPSTQIKSNSKIVIGAHTLRVIKMNECYDPFGLRLDHYEIHCDVWV